METCRVVIHIPSFWAGVRDLKQLGVLSRTCKTLRAECDMRFAVIAMGKDRTVKKVWAKRWLGLVDGWMRTSAELTLALALDILKEHGGMKATSQRAIAYRNKYYDAETARRKHREQLEEQRKRRLLVATRENTIYSKLNSYEIYGSRGCLYSAISQAAEDVSVLINDELFARLKVIHDQHLQKQLQKRMDAEERVKIFDSRMQRQGFPLRGWYYERTKRAVMFSNIEVTDDEIAQIGFKDTVGESKEFAIILKELIKSRGHKFEGMYGKAREIFSQRFVVGPNGIVFERLAGNE
jgi:hypothetical protein